MSKFLTKSPDGIFPSLINNHKRIFLVFCIIISFLIVDTMIHYVSDLIIPALISIPSIVLFTIIVCVSIFGQIVILEIVKSKSREITEKDSQIRSIQKVITSVQYVLITILVIVMLEILLTFQYHTVLLIVDDAIISTTSALALGLFSYKLFSWFRLNRNSIIVLLYGLSFSITAFSILLGHYRDIYLLMLKDSIVNSMSPVIFPYDYLEPGSLLDILFLAYRYIDTIGFGLLVAATAILLHHYSRRLGKVKFWILVTLPLVYNISTLLETAGLYTPTTDTEWFYWWLYVSLNTTAGGILFGFAFMSVARTIREDSSVRQYMTIAAYGFVLMFVSNQVVLVGASYPPVGIATLSFLPLATFMIFLGVYSTAVSISQDNQLRKSMRKLAKENSNLFGSIGAAQLSQETLRKIDHFKDVVQEQEKELEEKTGIEANFEEEDIKSIIAEVLQEVGKTGRTKK